MLTAAKSKRMPEKKGCAEAMYLVKGCARVGITLSAREYKTGHNHEHMAGTAERKMIGRRADTETGLAASLP